MRKSVFILAALALCLSSAAGASEGWSVSTSNLWRLNENADYAFTKGSPAKIMQTDRQIFHRQAKYTVRKSLLNTFTFKVGCMFQSRTPAFELQVQPLDIRVQDLFNGYVFARFLVDSGQEFSLRGEIVPPARLIFAPLTASQDKKISDLFLQMREGGELNVALLEGQDNPPRVFSVPLTGFIAFSDPVIEDCTRLNTLSGPRGQVGLLPDYITQEPAGYIPKKDWTLKPKRGNDGLTPVEEEPPAPEPPKEEPKPEIQYFVPGGGPASIGPDGKPIMKPESLGKSQGAMQIGPDGMPIAPAQGGAAQPADASAAQVAAPDAGNSAAPAASDAGEGGTSQIPPQAEDAHELETVGEESFFIPATSNPN